MSVLGILCALFIFGDASGYHEIGWGWIVLCWIIVMLDTFGKD